MSIVQKLQRKSHIPDSIKFGNAFPQRLAVFPIIVLPGSGPCAWEPAPESILLCQSKVKPLQVPR